MSDYAIKFVCEMLSIIGGVAILGLVGYGIAALAEKRADRLQLETNHRYQIQEAIIKFERQMYRIENLLTCDEEEEEDE